MALTYLLAPNPKWYIADLTGKPLGAGYMYTRSHLNPQTIKVIYHDASINNPWTDPVRFDENGSQGPFYWEIDSEVPTDTYDIYVYDRNMVLQWTILDFSPPGSGGGGGGTTVDTTRNLVTNNVMWRNTGPSPVVTTTLMKLAPGAHAGFSNNVNNPSGTYSGPDIYFMKNNTSATDTIGFPEFSFGSEPFGSFDVTPENYLNYICTGAGSGETTKLVQFPITRGVQNLSNQSVTVTIWGMGTGNSTTISLQFWQFFGDGSGVQTPQVSIIENIELTSDWVQYGPFTTTILPVSGSAGACGNDGLFLQVFLPNDATCDISFTKPSIYIGNNAPDIDYVTYDMIDSVINSPHTGDVTISLNNFAPYGYVAMNDGSIGSPASGGTARAATDTFPLYNLIWNSVDAAWAAMADGSARGADAITDFISDRAMYLTKALGRVMAGTLNVEIEQEFSYASSAGTSNLTGLLSSEGFYRVVPVRLLNNGDTLPDGLSHDITYYVIPINSTTIQLASSPDNAVSSIPVTFDGTTGSGTHKVQVTPYSLGQFHGEDYHTLTVAELAAHDHSGTAVISGSASLDGPGNILFGADSAENTFNVSMHVATEGSNTPHNTIQPTTYMNFFIKL